MSEQFSLDRCFTIKEAHEHLRISRAMLYKQIGAGTLRTIKIGTRTIIRGNELARFLDDAFRSERKK
jgi:excisionase family DNA binding protein